MAKSNGSIVVGTSFSSLLGLLFIALKLTKVITWSWGLVLLPIYGPAALIILVIVGFLLAVTGLGLLMKIVSRVAEARAERNRKKAVVCAGCDQCDLSISGECTLTFEDYAK